MQVCPSVGGGAHRAACWRFADGTCCMMKHSTKPSCCHRCGCRGPYPALSTERPFTCGRRHAQDCWFSSDVIGALLNQCVTLPLPSSPPLPAHFQQVTLCACCPPPLPTSRWLHEADQRPEQPGCAGAQQPPSVAVHGKQGLPCLWFCCWLRFLWASAASGWQQAVCQQLLPGKGAGPHSGSWGQVPLLSPGVANSCATPSRPWLTVQGRACLPKGCEGGCGATRIYTVFWLNAILCGSVLCHTWYLVGAMCVEAGLVCPCLTCVYTESAVQLLAPSFGVCAAVGVAVACKQQHGMFCRQSHTVRDYETKPGGGKRGIRMAVQRQRT
jgi:hypothetical protein